jgi:hypothetical protein
MTRAGAARVARTVVALVIGGLVAGAACAGPRNNLNTAASVCYRAVPAARAVVHDKGRLLGVRRRGQRTLAQRFPGVTVPPRAGPVCIIAYRGDYKDGDVRGTTGAGRYAIVVVDAKSMHVLRARVTDTLPLRFRHPV